MESKTISIQEQIKTLVELQKIDAEIYRLKKELAGQPTLQKKIDDEFDRKKSGLKTAEEASKTLQLKQKEKEMELQVKEEKVSKLQAQLYQLKSNKEYSAMELEIKGLKADKSLLEEEILKCLDAMDQAKGKLAEEKERLAGEEKKAKAETEVLKNKSADWSALLAAAEEKRKAYPAGVDAKLLSQYERILKSREGLALVPVRSGSCGGCHMELPPQVVNEIQMQDKLIVCESCARMLYWPA